MANEDEHGEVGAVVIRRWVDPGERVVAHDIAEGPTIGVKRYAHCRNAVERLAPT